VTLPKALDLDKLEGLMAEATQADENSEPCWAYAEAVVEAAPALIAAARESDRLRALLERALAEIVVTGVEHCADESLAAEIRAALGRDGA
jgi:hypothetical protein